MGLLVNGKWQDRWYATEDTKGRFVRETAQFRGRLGSTGFPAEKGRYHLYVSLACPWAHRTLIVRALKRLEGVLGVSIVEAIWGDEGWKFGDEEGATRDLVNSKRCLHEVYTLARSDYTGRVTVPVLWDRESSSIVCNESADIIRMLNRELDEWGDASVDLLPPEHEAEIDALNAEVYERVNNGVYRAGFATSQEVYEEAFDALFEMLDWLEERLKERRYLVGGRLTEADVRLFTTLARFDSVYHGHFKCNLRRLVDYPSLWAFTRDIYQTPGVAGTTNFEHIKRHYYASHAMLNPTRVIPKGPALDFDEPHGRESLDA